MPAAEPEILELVPRQAAELEILELAPRQNASA
jgi:hypothetical protein